MINQTINLNDLRRPKNYLRGTVNAVYVRKLEGDAREAMTTKDDKKTLIHSHWPFPIITVRKVEERKKETDKPTVFYEIIDGVNRVECARGLFPKGDFALVCHVKSYATDADAFADQIKLNNDNRGLYLDRDARDRGVILLRDTYHMSVRKIAVLCNMSHASVVRIKKGTQRRAKSNKRSLAAKARHAGKRQKAKVMKKSTAPTWSPKLFIRECEQMSRTYDDHQPEIAEMIKKAGDRAWKVGQPFATFVESLAG